MAATTAAETPTNRCPSSHTTPPINTRTGSRSQLAVSASGGDAALDLSAYAGAADAGADGAPPPPFEAMLPLSSPARAPGGAGAGGASAAAASAAAAAGRALLAKEWAADWALGGVALLALALTDAASPSPPYMLKADLPRLAYPLLPNTVPSWSVPLLAVAAPLLLLAAAAAALRRPRAELHKLAAGLVLSVLLTGCATNALKAAVRRPRPHFNARCWPGGAEKVEWRGGGDLYGGYPLCSNGDARSVGEGLKSFPSGGRKRERGGAAPWSRARAARACFNRLATPLSPVPTHSAAA